MSTVSKAVVVAVERDCYKGGLSSPEVTSSYAAASGEPDEVVMVDDEEEEELELGLCLGAKKSTKATGATGSWGEYCRILTAEDFPSMVPSRVSQPIPASPSSSSSSSPVSLGGGACGVGVAGIKRVADFVSPEAGSTTPSQLVGWPPIRAYRMNSLVSQSKGYSSEENHNSKQKTIGQTANTHQNRNIQENGADAEKKSTSLFVKVNMDGEPIGRKVDVNAHRSYDTLALALEDMFQDRSSIKSPINCMRASRLLDGSSEFVLTYEDKDGDWMLVGDVPWRMFMSTVKRLRIMRNLDANGLAPRFQSSQANRLR